MINKSKMFNKETSTTKKDNTTHLKMKKSINNVKNLRNKIDNKCQSNKGNNTKTFNRNQRRCLKENSL